MCTDTGQKLSKIARGGGGKFDLGGRLVGGHDDPGGAGITKTFGGGHASAALRADRAARASEAERKDRITQNISQINSAFAGRQPQYEDFATALRARFGDELAQQRAQASRDLKFSLARGGLTGGSTDVDANAELSRESEQGALGAEEQVQKRVGSLKSADQSARLQQIGLAESGNDIGDAAARTSEALQANLQGAQGENTTNALGDLFGNTATLVKNQKAAAASRRGLKDSEIYANGP